VTNYGAILGQSYTGACTINNRICIYKHRRDYDQLISRRTYTRICTYRLDTWRHRYVSLVQPASRPFVVYDIAL